eukprot:1017110-Ditylum_brightwellii.AAC.1
MNNAMFVDDAALSHSLCKVFIINCIALMAIVKYNLTLLGRYLWTLGKWLEYMKTQYCTLTLAFKQHGQPYLKSESELPEKNVTIKGTDGPNTKLK